MNNQITEAEFQKYADTAISQLEASFARVAEDRDLDVQVESGVLSVEFDEGEPGKFIVSPNSSVKQLWISARVSSFKFDWSEEAGGFVLAGTGEPVKQVLTRLTREQLRDDSIEL